MQVRLGESVFGIGGKQLGEVNGLIVDAGTKRARALLMNAGLLAREEHIVAISAVRTGDDEGLRLDATGARTEAQSPVLDSEEVSLAQRVEPETTFIPAAGVGGPVYGAEASVPGAYPDESSFFEIAPLDPPPVEIFSNLGENEVRLERGTHAISSDNHKVGAVVAFALGEMGLVETITVSEGFILKSEVDFPLADISEFGANAVHLRITKDEAASR